MASEFDSPWNPPPVRTVVDRIKACRELMSQYSAMDAYHMKGFLMKHESEEDPAKFIQMEEQVLMASHICASMAGHAAALATAAVAHSSRGEKEAAMECLMVCRDKIKSAAEQGIRATDAVKVLLGEQPQQQQQHQVGVEATQLVAAPAAASTPT